MRYRCYCPTCDETFTEELDASATYDEIVIESDGVVCPKGHAYAPDDAEYADLCAQWIADAEASEIDRRYDAYCDARDHS